MYLSATVFVTAFILTNANPDSIDEQPGFTYTNLYAPSTVNFHDIYTNTLNMLTEEPIATTVKEEDFNLSHMNTQFVEFHPQKPSTPPPKYILNSSYLKKQNETHNSTEETTTASAPILISPVTKEPEESVKVLPIKKDYQRGVLDLLFPAARVKTFKNVFDTFRRILSYTFRKR